MKTRTDAEQYIAAETNPHSGNLSQRARLLRLLLSTCEVELPQILDLRIGQYNARINELRSSGFDIRNRTSHISGVVHSWYALNFDPPHYSPDWYERQTGQKRPPRPPDLGPLFQAGTHG